MDAAQPARAGDLARYTAACDFTGPIDELAVERALAEYLAAFGMQRDIVRVRAGWSEALHPTFTRYVDASLEFYRAARAARAAWDAWDARAARAAWDARAARAAWDARAARAAWDARAARAAWDARAARAARDAWDARAARAAWAARAARAAWDAWDAWDVLDDPENANARRRFAATCIRFAAADVSLLGLTLFGAGENQDLVRWARPALEAFCAGAWFIKFTEHALFWVPHPHVHVERRPDGSRRLHNPDYAALECDVENLYFWKGVLVPDFVVLHPDRITPDIIDGELNAEVRRVMLERFGAARYVEATGAIVVDECPADHPIVGLRTARLLRKPLRGDEDLVLLDVLNSTPEPDGTVKRYQLRIDPNAYDGEAARSCVAAAASTWRRKGDHSRFIFARPRDYHPLAES